jgi:hypothetical protein
MRRMCPLTVISAKVGPKAQAFRLQPMGQWLEGFKIVYCFKFLVSSSPLNQEPETRNAEPPALQARALGPSSLSRVNPDS